MPSTLLARFASLLRRWIADLGTLLSNPHRLDERDQPRDFPVRHAALRPAYVRVRRESNRK